MENIGNVKFSGQFFRLTSLSGGVIFSRCCLSSVCVWCCALWL